MDKAVLIYIFIIFYLLPTIINMILYRIYGVDDYRPEFGGGAFCDPRWDRKNMGNVKVALKSIFIPFLNIITCSLYIGQVIIYYTALFIINHKRK